jgi:hypothetical protein
MSANCELIAAHKEHTESPRGVHCCSRQWGHGLGSSGNRLVEVQWNSQEREFKAQVIGSRPEERIET